MTELTERLNRFEDRLHSLESELVELRRLAATTETEAVRPAEEPLWTLYQAPEETPEPIRVAPPRVEPPAPRIELSELFGARALAWTGGSVTLLGIVFFFVLAVERGWISPWTRVSLGATAAVLCLAAGAWLHRRFGDTYAAVSAAGAGVAGLYATLLAATALYDLVPRPAALAVAGAIAAIGAALAVRWRSQTLACLGLLGALLVPVPIAFQDGHLSPIGTAFAAIVLAATVLVALPRAWNTLQTTATVVAMIESMGLVLAHEPHASTVAVAVWLVSTAGAVSLTLRGRVSYLPATLTALTATFAGWSAAILYAGDVRGYVLLGVAVAYAVVSAAVWRRDRDAAAVLWAIALTVSAIGAATLVSGTTLTLAWAAEAAALAWLARRVDEPRFELGSVIWLALAFVHGLALDASPAKLFVSNDDTWTAALSASALALGTGLVALHTTRRAARVSGFALAGGAGLYAASLFVVTLPSSWDWGHVTVAGLWACVAVALLAAGLQNAAAIVAAAATVLVLAYDLPFVAEPQRWWAFAVVAAAATAIGVGRESLSSRTTVDLFALGLLSIGVALSTAAAFGLLEGHALGSALLGLGAAYIALGVGLLARRRDFASAAGAAGLALVVPGSTLLLGGTWLVLAWVGLACALAILSSRESRLAHAAVAFLGLALVHTLVLEAPPSDLFVAHRHPGAGAPAVALCVIVAAVLAWRRSSVRVQAAWFGGALGLYAVTLAMLELFEDSGASIDTAFQRGHTAVSALWGVVGLMLLVAGLKHAGRRLRTAGFALFGASLVKLFVYDLAHLSSVARAGSFLAVGGVLLAGGFLYQRLATGTGGSTLDSPA